MAKKTDLKDSCACFVIATLNELFPNDYLIIVSNETVRDMKASFYLAMSGRYRQAVLIQRCVFESFLYGLYFFTDLFLGIAFLVNEGIASRKIASNYLNELVKVGILKKEAVGRENIYLNIGLYDLLSD